VECITSPTAWICELGRDTMKNLKHRVQPHQSIYDESNHHRGIDIRQSSIRNNGGNG
jgi:hypothetical protein